MHYIFDSYVDRGAVACQRRHHSSDLRDPFFVSGVRCRHQIVCTVLGGPRRGLKGRLETDNQSINQ
jgi:hypothetical protein